MIILAAALALGFLGSAHCVTMCGPVAGLCAASSIEVRPSLRRAVAFNLGRIGTYTALGAVFGAFGQSIEGTYAYAPQAGLALRVIAACTAIAAGAALVSGRSALTTLEKFAQPLGRFVKSRTSQWAIAANVRSFLALGFAWGLIPCGLVYSALALATTSESATSGALTMLCFGLGTAPVLIAIGIASRALRSLATLSLVRRGAGTLLIVVGALQLANTVAPAQKPTCCHPHT